MPLLQRHAVQAGPGAAHARKQMWYDDPASLLIKRGIVTRLGLRGFGPYQLDDLDTNGTRTGNPRAREESRRMWEVLSLEP